MKPTLKLTMMQFLLQDAQNDIISTETKVSQIVSAINSLTSTIDDLRNKINQAAGQTDSWTQEKTTVTATITVNEKAKADLLEKLNGLNNNLGQKVKELSDKNSECQTLANTANNKARDLDTAENDLRNIEVARRDLVVDINNKSGVVDDLRDKLRQAEKDLADAKIRLADLDAKRLSLPVTISNLRREVDDLNRRVKACQDEVARLQAIIDSLKSGDLTDLTNQIKDLDRKITDSRTIVSTIDTKISGSQGPLQDLKAKLAQANEDLAFLRTQKTETDNNLRVAYQRGNDANNRVAFAKQNLDAVIRRFQDESKIVSDATLNLERARAEEALARLALE